jgi:hypothetical protein
LGRRTHTEVVRRNAGRLAIVAAAVIAGVVAARTGARPSKAPTKTATAATSSTGSPSMHADASGSASEYRAVLSRPLHLPGVGPGQGCPTSHGAELRAPGFAGVAQGSGPVRPLLGDTHGRAELTSRTQHAGWLAAKSLWFSDPSYHGPFLVRLRRLDRPGPVGVLESPGRSSFMAPPVPTITGTDGYREVTGATWLKTPGCIGWQVDGLTFSNIIVVNAVCRPPLCRRRNS